MPPARSATATEYHRSTRLAVIQQAVSGWKLLRFLRGNGGSVPKALEAYEKMVRFRDEGRVAEFRAALVESAGCSPDAPIDQIVKTMVWPYFHPKVSTRRLWPFESGGVLGHHLVRSFLLINVCPASVLIVFSGDCAAGREADLAWLG